MATPFPRLSPPHFFAPEKMLRIFLYRAQKNVAYNQNVRRQFFNLVGGIKIMEKINFNEIVDVFEINTELNIGIFPNKNIVKYGFSCIDNELTLYIQVSDENINKDSVSENKQINFYKWSSKGIVSGDWIVKILETKKEKTNGLKYIMKQQIKMGKEYSFNENELDDLYIIKILVENMYKTY
jgi:hypothetical protein